MFKECYWAWDGVLDKAFCDYVLSNRNWDDAEEAKVRESGIPADPSTRISQVLWEDYTSPIAAVAFHYTYMANKHAGWDFEIEYPQQVQIGRYAKDGHYDWHIDSQMPDAQNNQRKLSCSIILNDPSEYEGGDLEFNKIDNTPPKTRGSIIVFPSMLEHRVTPVTSGVRYSAVCWTVGAAFK
jgi:PKHD-type hydroxylase